MDYKKFNLVCVALIAFFIVGNFWVWYRNVVDVVSVENVVDVEIVDRKDIIEEKEQFEQVEQYNNLNNEVVVVEDENIKVENLQTEINLNIPFTSQAPESNWDQPWQDACEEAAILMLDAYYKDYNLSPLFSRDEILKMVEWEENKNWGTSIDAKKVELLAEWYLGRGVSVVEDPTIKQIKNYVSNGNPVLVLAYGKDLPNPNFRSGGPDYHALIIRGYTEDKFITNDPGTRNGENFIYDYDDLMNALHDWNGGDVENGRKVVLVVE